MIAGIAGQTRRVAAAHVVGALLVLLPGVAVQLAQRSLVRRVDEHHKLILVRQHVVDDLSLCDVAIAETVLA